MKPALVRPKMPAASGTPGVYVGLDELIRLQYKARDFSFLPRQPIHSLLSGRHASRMRGRGLNFEELRNYLPGDDPRTIDWKVTARTQEPHVRVFTEERDRPALFVVDQRIAMFYGTKVELKSVTAAKVAALGAWRVLDQGDRVGGLVFDDREITEVRPHRSQDAVMRLLGAVVKKNHALRAGPDITSNPAMLDLVLEQAARIAKHDNLVTVVSDFDGVDEATRRLVLRLSEHNDVLLALVHDPSATELPEMSRLVVSDGELQLELDLGESKVRKRVEQYGVERLERVIAWQREMGVPVLPINTAEDPIRQVARLLGATSALRT